MPPASALAVIPLFITKNDNMNRKQFLKYSLGAGAAAVFSPKSLAIDSKSNQGNKKSEKILNAYYFRAHMYTCVPGQIREDMKWMAGNGTDVVSIGVIEQDLWAAVENIEIVVNEAAKQGMQVYVVPSRWGGLVAGAPKVPSLFSVKNPDTWMKNDKGETVHSSVSGVISSIYAQKTRDFVKESLDKVFELWDIKGIIWDEPKTFNRIDYSDNATKKRKENPSYEDNLNENIHFYSDINQHIKNNHPDIQTCLFLYAQSNQDIINAGANIKHLDYYGCDGRPWYPNDGGKDESTGKTLLENGERFLKAAHQHNKKSLWLVENHNMLDKDAELMDKRFPEVLEKPVDHLIYYYYPRNLQTPDKIMKVIAKHIKKFK
jgi:hypothetical protein